ncbi:MAG: hypothetical protein KDA24_01840 [Deltaproteobacteria bacterium]|nr:hypothetical protein [Deltaproteobacteria bacterium]
MPDLLTHTLLNVALPAGRLRRRELLVFVFGGVLPDIVSRVPAISISRTIQPIAVSQGVDLDWVVTGFGALHLPLGLLFVVTALAAGLPRFLLDGVPRRRLAALLLGGGVAHLLLDVMQWHVRPSYRYLFPFSMRPLELGWFDSDVGFFAWPILVPLAWWAWRRSDP